MPIIQEISDEEDTYKFPGTPSDEQKASVVLDKCLDVLMDDSRPLESRYNEILSIFPLIERFPSAAPLPFVPFESKLLQLLRPHSQLYPQQTFGFDEPDSDSTSPAISLYQTVSHKILSLLTDSRIALTPTPELAAVLASFTSTSDSWTTSSTHRLSAQLLSRSLPTLLDSEILIDGVLRDTLKPLFTARTTSAARVTSTGRLALRETTNRRINTDIPAWLQQRPESIAILEWALSGINSVDIEPAWGLLIPPILTLIDSTLSPVKTRAIGMVTLLLRRLDETESTRTLLHRTGLAPVFWDAVLPCLSYLPPLTPTPEAVPLLKASYICLLALVRAREPKNTRKKGQLLDVVVREGFLRGLAFADEHVLVVAVMVEQLAPIVEEMGVWAVRHLNNIVPALAEILASPFGDTFPPLLAQAADTLQVIIRVCWLRMGAYVAEVLRGVTVCWERIFDSRKDLEEVRTRLRAVVGVLKAVVVSKEGGVERWTLLEVGIRGVDETVFGALFEASKAA